MVSCAAFGAGCREEQRLTGELHPCVVDIELLVRLGVVIFAVVDCGGGAWVLMDQGNNLWLLL